MIRPDPALLANKRPLSAVLNELAPGDRELDERERFEAFDKVLAGLLSVDDPEFRSLLCDMAAGHLKIGVKNGQARLRRALDEWAQSQAAIAAAAAAEAEITRQREQAEALRKRPPLDRFNDLVATATDGWDHLLFSTAPAPATLDPAARLRVCDELLAVILPMPDQELRGLYAKQLADHLDLKPKDVTDRLKRAQAALNTPAGPVVGGEVKDGGFHERVIGSLRRYLQHRGIFPDAVNGWLDDKGKPVSVKTRELVNDFHFTHASYFESLPRDRIDITLSALTQEGRNQRRAAIIGRLCGKPSTVAGAEALRTWLMATTHRDDPTDFAVMKHWIWQVKRLNTNRSVAWDLMPILVGGQGDGKSTAIEQILCSPWAELLININAQTLVDDRSTEVLGDHAVGFWGEISGGNKAEVQALKNTLTSKRKSYRELGGHHHNVVIRRMAFIGDSNSSVKDIIADSTGMRRFYEIHLNGPTDHATLNALDPALIWEAVSEDDPAPFDGVATVVRERQKDLVAQDSFDHFLTWCQDRQWAKLIILLQGQPYIDGQPPTLTVPAYKDDRGYTLPEVCALFRYYVANVGGGIQRGDTYVSKRLRETGWTTHRPQRLPGEIGRPVRWIKPAPPAEPVEPDAVTQAELAARATKMVATPHPGEDAFAKPATAPTATIEREPGADEEEGTYQAPEVDDGPVDE